MRKLLIKLSILFVLLVIIDVSLGAVVELFEDKAIRKNPESFKLAYTVECQDAPILIVGASDAARNVVPSVLQEHFDAEVFNAGNPGCYITYQCCMLNLMLDRNQNLPQVIIWSFLPDMLSTHVSEIEESRYINDFYRYKDDSYVRTNMTRFKSKRSIFICSNLYKYNGCILKYLKSFSNRFSTNYDGFQPLFVTDCKYPSRSTVVSPSNVIDLRKYMLVNTVKRIKEHNIVLVVLTPPVFANGAIRETEQYATVRDICNSNNVPFIDGMDFYEIRNDSTLFWDAFHLNSDGAYKYSKELLPYMDEALKYKKIVF